MLASQIPAKWLSPFAASGTKNVIPLAPVGGAAPNASQQGGFPPITFTPITAGGAAPLGADFNGAFNQTTAWDQWFSMGGPVGWDSGFSTAIGGYVAGSLIGVAGVIGGYWLSQSDNNTTDPDTGGGGWVFVKPSPWSDLIWAAGGTANAITITLNPAALTMASLVGEVIRFTVASGNTGAVTMNVNSLGAFPLTRSDGAALQSGDLATVTVFTAVVASATTIQMIGPVSSQVQAAVAANSATDTSGTPNLIVAAPSPAIPYTVGTTARIVPANANTGPVTANFNAAGAIAVQHPDGTALVPGDLVAGRWFDIVFKAGPVMQMLSWPQNTAGANNTVTGSGHAYAIADAGKTTLRSNSGTAMVDTLPGGGGALPAGWTGTIVNTDTTGLLAIGAGSGSTLTGSGVSNGWLVIGPGQKASITSDGTNYTCYGAPGRAKLLANTTLFVATGGSDTANSGITSGSAFLTVNHAYSWAQQSLDLNGFQLTIARAAGSYTDAMSLSGPLVGQASPVILSGAGSGSTTVTASVVVSIGTAANVQIQSQTFASNATGGACCNVGIGGVTGVSCVLTVGTGMVFSQSSGQGIFISNASGMIIIAASYSASGSGNAHFETNGFAEIIVNSTITVTLTGTPAYTSGFCFVIAGGGFVLETDGAITFSGSATGPRFNIVAGAIINTNGFGANFFPGSSAGTGQTSNYF